MFFEILVFNVSKKIHKNMHITSIKLALSVLISNIVKIDILKTMP